MSQRTIHQHLSKLLVLAVGLNLMLLLGCGGTAGVENGSIIGKVFSNLRDASATRGPESNVNVLVQREGGTPPIIRTTFTDANGNFVVSDLPNGQYVIGYAKEGFRVIGTQAGDTSQRTALGTSVRVFVDNGRTSVAPEVTLRALEPTGDAIVIVTVQDQLTGLPITDATVTAGPVSTTQNTNGVYTLTVPLVGRPDEQFGTGTALAITIQAVAEGFVLQQLLNQRVFPGQTRRFTIALPPLGAQNAVTVDGTFRFSSFQSLLSLIQGISLRVQDTNFVGTVTNATGIWLVTGLPASTSSITRQFNFVFSHPDLKTFVLQRVVLPKQGTKTITQPVVLEPNTVDVMGMVFVGANPDQQLIPNGADDRVTIQETGQTASLVNGSFLIPRVPTRQAPSSTPYTIRVTATDPQARIIRCQDISNVRPTSDGSANPVFILPKIVVTGPCQSTGGG
jgi:hypothetical protein